MFPDCCSLFCRFGRSHNRLIWIGQGAILAFLWSTLCHAQLPGAQINREDLRPGLVAVHRDGRGTEVCQLEAAVAFTLGKEETPHPRLAADGAVSRWDGFINVFRSADYTFSVQLHGKFKLWIDGKELLSGEGRGTAAVIEKSAPIKLAAGAHAISAEFIRLDGESRLELFWESPLFIKEPLGIANLRHLPAKTPRNLESDAEIERGRFWVEELNCVRCHKPGDALSRGLETRQAPDLSRIGERINPAWLYTWLKDPQHQSSTAVMPKLFADDAADQKELADVVLYLSSTSRPMAADTKMPAKAVMERGKQLFNSVGCAVCHPDKSEKPAEVDSLRLFALVDPAKSYREFKLPDQGNKTNMVKLAAYLQEPHKTDPSGRMPSLKLDAKDAQALAAYLCFGKQKTAPLDVPGFAPDATAARRGKLALAARGCVSCHNLNDGATPVTSALEAVPFNSITQPGVGERGCLATDVAKRGKAPVFAQTSLFPAIRKFLVSGSRGAGSASPPHAARVALQRFNCLACHTREGEGGLTSDAVALLRKYEKAENGETISPPTLTGVAHKLRTPWFHSVLTAGGRSRPWMGLRMPQFGEAQVGRLPEAIAALEGTTPDDAIQRIQATSETIAAGRQLIGKNKGYGCVTCHDVAGIPNSGTRGPDLAVTVEHVRFDWYRRWLESAQRMDPGTKMPSIILDGKVMLDTVLGGNADRQAEAMWAYLSLGQRMPLPDGIAIAKGMVLGVGEKPLVLRTFMPDAGTRSIAIGYPGGVSTAFDAGQCHPAYVWAGGFVDASPVWANRGGSPAKVLGGKFWSAPPGFPWSEGPSAPDFAAQARDPAFGATMPEGTVFRGEKRLFFQGYKLDSAGQPVFDYRFTTDKNKSIQVTEQPGALYHGGNLGLDRRFNLEIASGSQLWFNVASVPGPLEKIRFADRKGTIAAADPRSNLEGVPLEQAIVVPDADGRYLVYTTVDAPPAGRWHLQPSGSDYRLLIELPRTNGSQNLSFALRVWSVPQVDATILADLLGTKR